MKWVTGTILLPAGSTQKPVVAFAKTGSKQLQTKLKVATLERFYQVFRVQCTYAVASKKTVARVAQLCVIPVSLANKQEQ